jgi:hypothetical protein
MSDQQSQQDDNPEPQQHDGQVAMDDQQVIRKMSSVLISLDLFDSSGSSISKTENCILICLESRERLQIVLGLFADFNLILA